MRVFAAFLGLFVLGFAAIAAFTYPAWVLLHPHFDFPFHRIGERIGMLALLLGLVLTARRLRLNDRASLGFGLPRSAFLREMLLGLGLGALSMTAVVAVMGLMGLITWSAAASLTAGGVAKLVLTRALSGLAVAFIEETFIRGAMLTGIARESGVTAAVLLTSLIYAATHFFASYKIPAADVTATSGLDLISGTLHLFAHPLSIADAFSCLFAVGVVLAVIRVITGNIAAGIGLHAGWVWVMLVAHDLSQPVRDATLSFLLSRFDGFIGWLVLAWTLVLGIGLSLFYVTAHPRQSPREPRHREPYVSGASNSKR
jgi:membrane protease YdiL (CAAX protease family)